MANLYMVDGRCPFAKDTGLVAVSQLIVSLSDPLIFHSVTHHHTVT